MLESSFLKIGDLVKPSPTRSRFVIPDVVCTDDVGIVVGSVCVCSSYSVWFPRGNMLCSPVLRHELIVV